MWKDSETEIDFLDYGYMVNILKEIVCNDNLLPASIGIYGDWGSGKSSLMHMCIKELEKDGRAKCLIFNGWLFESYGDAKSSLLNSILDVISKEKNLSDKAKDILRGLYKSVDKLDLAQKAIKYGGLSLLSGGVGAFAGITGETAFAFIKNHLSDFVKSDDKNDILSKIRDNINDELNENSLREDIRVFQSQFEALLNESNIDRLAIFIDELDRCREDTILDTLEAMKLFMFTGKVAFVIGADERHISYAVKSKFKNIEGIQIDIGKEYLEKLVQYPIKIPRMDIDETEVYISSLLLSAEVKEETFAQFQEEVFKAKKESFGNYPLKTASKITLSNSSEDTIFKECLSIARQLAAVLSNGLHGNPRQVKRFLNSLDMRMKAAEYKGAKLDRKILAKLMMLEYIRPAAFKVFAEMARTNELMPEIAILETNPTEEGTKALSRLQSWLKDDWLLNWIGITPALTGTELNQYLYFARTSLDEKISRISVNLSPEAQKALESLMSKSDVKINEALKTDVSEAEAGIILEAMANQMTKDANVDKMHVKAFVGFSLAKPTRYVSALEYIKSFPSTALDMASMVYMAKFAKKSGLQQEMQELSKKWGKTNEDLEKAFNNCMKIGE
jgi:hypothetical protein